MLSLKAKWWKPEAGKPNGNPIDVIVRGFGQAQTTEGGQRPVAIIQDCATGKLRYVELKFVQIEGDDNAKAQA